LAAVDRDCDLSEACEPLEYAEPDGDAGFISFASYASEVFKGDEG
jgi:hypothetical protein